ncbi:MAG: phosphomannomutase/phosphoglucomutase [Patescibacteria group bacterium]|nr:phosphomannomutase/phosphoglucomutase [Patescibacteria group bacterium]MDD5490281.1 phosphomannomutase/phosphoglucomutase [Patescibacteria group bacterium]
MSKISKAIFKAYDIRGICPTEINPEVAKRVGQAVVEFTKAKIVVVGRDARESSEELSRAVVEGVISMGADVVDIGLCSTPIFNFAVAENIDFEAGIMVTASHNPAEYNGFKMDFNDGLPVSRGAGMEEIKNLVSVGNFKEAPKKGAVKERDYLLEYLERVFTLVDKNEIKKLKVVVDTGNGMGGLTMSKVFERIPPELVPLYFELDGTFPNHEANPLKEENLVALKEKVLAVGADLGVAFDGDADRVGFIDEKGETISGDLITALIAQELLRIKGSGRVLYDLRSSNIVSEVVKAAGGEPEMCAVGHATIKKIMAEKKALFAGELSSHFYYRDFYNVESGDLTLLLVLSLLSRSGGKMSALAAPLKKYFQSGEINSEVENKEEIMKKLEEIYGLKAKSISHIDGIRIDLDGWWFNVRPSNTEPLLRLNLEAETKEIMEEKRDEILNVIKG